MERYQEGMVSLAKHRNTIRELKEKWAEELMTQKLCGEELQKELKDLKKFKSMQVEKRPAICSFSGTIGYQNTILLLPCVFIRAVYLV